MGRIAIINLKGIKPHRLKREHILSFKGKYFEISCYKKASKSEYKLFDN